MTKRAVIITASILLGLIATLTILFGMVFRVKNIDFVYGDNFYYKQQISDILKSSKLNKNDSIFSVKHNKIINNIELEYPYARVEGVNIKSFTNITIKLSNRIPLYYFVENEQCFILDEDCKVLEKISVQNFNINNYKLVQLISVFSAGEKVQAGQFIGTKYAEVCSDLYKSIYSNAMLNLDNGQGVFEDRYLNRDDICDTIIDLRFNKVNELNGLVDKLILSTSYGTKISIIEPQKDIDLKINMAFSALRTLIKEDGDNGTSLSSTGSIVVRYSYNNNVVTPA
ncbi:MAG: hypothetical protein J6Q15_02670, partial [Clostridia bacterium]|nr:hypothetical protein [Clostridia bacterium]